MTRLETPDTHDLEGRLRASLTERASDVTASPELWEKVDDRITARRRSTMFAWAGSLAVVAAAAAIVVPNLLDDGPRPPQILEQPSEGGPTDGPTQAPAIVGEGVIPDPEYVVAMRDGEVVVIRLADGQEVDAFATGPLYALAARPRSPGDPLTLAGVTDNSSSDGADWVVQTISHDLVDDDLEASQLGPGGRVNMLASQPRSINGRDVLSPGVAWAPSGDWLAWLETIDNGGVLETRVIVERANADGTVEGERTSFLLADGATAGRLTLKDWTWDAQFEDGRVGRLFLTGDGRSWEVEISHSFDIQVAGGLDPIDYGDDFDQAGPAFGLYRLFVDQRAGELRVEPADDQAQPKFSFGRSLDELPSASYDLAVGNGIYVLSLGDRLFIGDQESTGQEVGVGQAWGPVDLVSQAWIPVYRDEGGMVPDDQPTNATDDPTMSPVVLPQFVVTTDGTSIALRWSDGRLIQELHSMTGARVLGMDVRPGSSTEDLTVAFTILTDAGEVSAWSLRGRADDQAGLAVDVLPFNPEHQPTPGTGGSVDGERSVPVFSDDGAYVAFVENDGQVANLRVFGWPRDADVPGTGNTADDNASWELGNAPRSLESFSEMAVSRSGGPGYLVEFTSSDGTASSCEFDRQGDNGLGLIICEADRAPESDVVDLTNRWLLETIDGRLRLYDPSLGQSLPLPEEMAFADPVLAWMTGRDGHAFVGDGQRAWLVTHDGAQELPVGTSYVVGVR